MLCRADRRSGSDAVHGHCNVHDNQNAAALTTLPDGCHRSTRLKVKAYGARTTDALRRTPADVQRRFQPRFRPVLRRYPPENTHHTVCLVRRPRRTPAKPPPVIRAAVASDSFFSERHHQVEFSEEISKSSSWKRDRGSHHFQGHSVAPAASLPVALATASWLR